MFVGGDGERSQFHLVRATVDVERISHAVPALAPVQFRIRHHDLFLLRRDRKTMRTNVAAAE